MDKYRLYKKFESDVYDSLKNHIPEDVTDEAFEELYDEIKETILIFYTQLLEDSDG